MLLVKEADSYALKTTHGEVKKYECISFLVEVYKGAESKYYFIRGLLFSDQNYYPLTTVSSCIEDMDVALQLCDELNSMNKLLKESKTTVYAEIVETMENGKRKYNIVKSE